MEATESMHAIIDAIVFVMEGFAILVIVAGIVIGAARYVSALLRHRESEPAYQAFKAFMGRYLSLGLEILVAADVVRTVILEPTMENIIVLGILVLIRTFLSWSLVVEIEGRWPWQKRNAEPDA